MTSLPIGCSDCVSSWFSILRGLYTTTSSFYGSLISSSCMQLRRFLYGLKRAPRAWFQCFSTHLENLGFCLFNSRHFSFTYIHRATPIYLLVYVDDILVTGNITALIVTLIKDWIHADKDLIVENGRAHE